MFHTEGAKGHQDSFCSSQKQPGRHGLYHNNNLMTVEGSMVTGGGGGRHDHPALPGAMWRHGEDERNGVNGGNGERRRTDDATGE